MKLKELRESVGVKQKELLREMQAEGIKATQSDISRIENGMIETYLFLAYKAEEILKRFIRKDPKNAIQAKIESCNRIADLLYERISEKGFTNYEDMLFYTGESDRRKIRRGVEEARKKYPIVDMDGGGWRLAADIHDCDKQLRIYERKKRIYSYQETPLIAKKYELRRALYGRADTELLRDNSREREV